MAVEQRTLDAKTRRARAEVRITFGRDDPLGPDEIAALNEGSTEGRRTLLAEQMELVTRFLTQRGWPPCIGGYWTNDDGSRLETASIKPEWATRKIKHPAQCYPPRSPERDAFDILLRCEALSEKIRSGAPAEDIAELAIDLGMIMGRNNFESQFGRACDIGIGRILSGRKGGQAYADTTEFLRERRLGALQRAIDAQPGAGPSEWARGVAAHWPDSEDPEAAARKFYGRNKGRLRHEIPVS